MIVNLSPMTKLTDDVFEQLCRANPDVKFERDANGALIIVAPTGGNPGSYSNCRDS